LTAPGAPDTDELLRKARFGDKSARDRLLARHRERLRRMVAVRMDDRLSARVDPSDVVQEALVVASRQFPAYLRNPPLPLYPWLRQIAWNRLVDLNRRHIQSAKRSVRREESLGISGTSAAELAEQLVARESGPVKRALVNEMKGRVRAALAQLGTMDREILILRHLEQLSAAESAAILKITPSAAKQRHVRALRRIRRLLHDEETPGGST
jgi:RNA polymerase sigma-70 factor (ECF subfamily)